MTTLPADRPPWPPRPPRPGATREQPPRDWRELAFALGTANLALTEQLPAIKERLELLPEILTRLERLEARLLSAEIPPLPPLRDKLLSEHDAQEMIEVATRSERVRDVVRRYSLETGGRVLLWAAGIAAALFVAGASGYVLRDCAARGMPVAAPTHP